MNIQSEAERIFEGAAFFNKWLKELTESEKEIVQQMIELSATYEQERSKVLREALEKIVRAWESLPGNKNYAPKEIERWLGDVMSPAIDAAREALAARTEGDGEDLRIKMLEEMKDWAMDAMDIGETGDEIKYSVNDFLADCDIWIERCKTTPFTP
jgi:hypothetical protein